MAWMNCAFSSSNFWMVALVKGWPWMLCGIGTELGGGPPVRDWLTCDCDMPPCCGMLIAVCACCTPPLGMNRTPACACDMPTTAASSASEVHCRKYLHKEVNTSYCEWFTDRLKSGTKKQNQKRLLSVEALAKPIQVIVALSCFLKNVEFVMVKRIRSGRKHRAFTLAESLQSAKIPPNFGLLSAAHRCNTH